MVLTLSFMLPELVLPSPTVTLCVLVVWAIMLGLKCLLCVEMVLKYGRLIGGSASLPSGRGSGIAGLSSLFCSNSRPIIFTPRKDKHIGGFHKLQGPDSA